jgi:hypothetical protein
MSISRASVSPPIDPECLIEHRAELHSRVPSHDSHSPRSHHATVLRHSAGTMGIAGVLLLSGCRLGLTTHSFETVTYPPWERSVSIYEEAYAAPTSSPKSILRDLDLLSKPFEVDRLDDGTEVRVYRGTLRWAGIVPEVLIPIPLLVPFFRERTTVTMKSGRVVTVAMKRKRESFYGCGYEMGPCMNFGFSAGSRRVY